MMQLIESQDTLLNTVRLINNLILAAILIWMIHTSLIYFTATRQMLFPTTIIQTTRTHLSSVSTCQDLATTQRFEIYIRPFTP